MRLRPWCGCSSRVRVQTARSHAPPAIWCCSTSTCPDAAAWNSRQNCAACRCRHVQRFSVPPAVVFVTAHAEHALKAFDLEAVDYLTKPVRLDRLQQALQRAASRLGSLAPIGLSAGAAAAVEPVLVVTERGRVIRVPLAEVLYLKAELKYVTLRTEHHTHVLDDALSDLEQRLGPRFLRVHRNALVARSAVMALERRPMGDDEEPGDSWAVLVGTVEEWLAVSRRQVGAVREALEASGL